MFGTYYKTVKNRRKFRMTREVYEAEHEYNNSTNENDRDY